MKKLVLCMMILCLLLSACVAAPAKTTGGSTPPPAPIATEPSAQSTEPPQIDLTTTPAIQLRINETTWKTVDLTPYLGQSPVWISFPVEISELTEGFNQFAVHSNAYNHGNRTDKSLDVFFTMTAAGADSYVSQDMMSTWEPFSDRYANIILELYDGTEWHTFPEGETYQTDESIVAGIYVDNNGIYNVCRNISVSDLDRYTQARVSVLTHVGTTLMEEPEPEPIDEGDGYSELDTQVPVLKVKLNGGPCARLDLTPYLGTESVWVEVPLDVTKLRSGTNWVLLDSNVDNTENYSDHSVDVYFTPSEDCTDSKLSTDGRLSWIDYADHRYINLYLMLHNTQTDQWETLPGGVEYRDDSEHVVIGQFSYNEWLELYHVRRGIQIEDISNYDQVKACVQIHVGTDLSLIEAEP